MDVKEITGEDTLRNFTGSQKMSQFLQSWQWGEFQKKIGRKIWRLGVFNNEKLAGSALIIQQPLPFGKSYLYVPRGPMVDTRLAVEDFKTSFNNLTKKIINLGEELKAIFIKIEPPLEKHSQRLFEDVIVGYNFKPAGFVQPQDSWYLDLSITEEELLGNMHHKCRYNIRLAEKKGVSVRIGAPSDLEIFWQLNLATRQRDQFVTHSKLYYQKMLEALAPTGFLKLFIAEYQSEPVAANIAGFFGDMATYIHGASGDKHRNIMAPHLLQWRQIIEAKNNGNKYYDFWGIAPTGSLKQKDWAGITRFKKGFGGNGISYLGAYDLILNPIWYKFYKMARKIKR